MQQSNVKDQKERDEIFSSVNEFIKDAARNKNLAEEQKQALIAYSGRFWNEAAVKRCNRKDRANFNSSPWRTLVNAVASRMSASPYHCEIRDDKLPKEWGIQNLVNEFEARLSSKASQLDAFKRGIACGAGYLHIISDGDHPKAEVVRQQTAVFIDPWARSPSLEDANQAAIVNFISKKKAERDYGFTGNRVECQNAEIYTHSESAAFVSYYCKDEDGHVIRYEICGDWIQRIDLPCKVLPLVRFAGYETTREEGTTYEGVVQLTYDLQASSNIALSSLVERMNSGSNATAILTPIQAMGGAALNADGTKNANGIAIQEGMKSFMQGKSNVFPYDGNGGSPTFHENHFASDDLTSVIQMNRTLMEDCTGIQLQGMDVTDKSATEILIQENSKDASVTELYLNAEIASRTVAKIILQLLCGGQTPVFELENGPSVIIKQMKERQRMAIVAEMASPELHPYLAAKLSEMLDLPKDVSATLYANLGDLQVINEEDNVESDGEVISMADALNKGRQAQYQLAQSQATVEEAINENQELKNENATLTQELENQKAQLQLQITELKARLVEMQARVEKTDAETEKVKAEATSKEISNMNALYGNK